MKKKKKYYAGGGTIGINYLESPLGELVQNDINVAKAQSNAATNPLTMAMQMLGSLSMNYGFNNMMALGGTTDGTVEVENKEVAETPDGQLMEFKGATHEQGGINANLPDGTDIFSERIKVKGVSMAERKKAREIKLAKMKKKLAKNPTDSILKDTIARLEMNNEKADQEDMQLQEMIGMLEKGSKGEYALGGTTGGPINPNLISELVSLLDPNAIKAGLDKTVSLNYADTPAIDPSTKSAGLDTTIPAADSTGGNNLLDKITSALGNINLEKGPNSQATAGNILGTAGSLVSTFAPLLNTRKNRAGDTPNVNYFEDFGTDALQTIQDAQSFVDDTKAAKLQNLQSRTASQRKRNRNSARSINTQRALDLQTEANANLAENNIYSDFANQMMRLLGQEAQQENLIDRTVMQGEAQRDTADRQDRDNYFTNLASDFTNIGSGLQATGKNLNAMQTQKVMMNLLNQMSKYGITVDGSGTISKK
jgi:hypothetical protein